MRAWLFRIAKNPFAFWFTLRRHVWTLSVSRIPPPVVFLMLDDTRDELRKKQKMTISSSFWKMEGHVPMPWTLWKFGNYTVQKRIHYEVIFPTFTGIHMMGNEIWFIAFYLLSPFVFFFHFPVLLFSCLYFFCIRQVRIWACRAKWMTSGPHIHALKWVIFMHVFAVMFIHI